MIVFYDSLTGLGKRFANNLGYEIKDVVNLSLEDMDKDLFLITRSFNFGEVPDTTLDFLDDLKDNNKLDNLKGVAVTGNKNWGINYGKSGDTIEKDYGIKLVLKFEASGFPKDVKFVKEYLENIED